MTKTKMEEIINKVAASSLEVLILKIITLMAFELKSIFAIVSFF
jgi:hypothetical protein